MKLYNTKLSLLVVFIVCFLAPKTIAHHHHHHHHHDESCGGLDDNDTDMHNNSHTDSNINDGGDSDLENWVSSDWTTATDTIPAFPVPTIYNPSSAVTATQSFINSSPLTPTPPVVTQSTVDGNPLPIPTGDSYSSSASYQTAGFSLAIATVFFSIFLAA